MPADRVVHYVLRGRNEASSVFKGVYVDAVGAIRGIIDIGRELSSQFSELVEKARSQEVADRKLAAALGNVKGASTETFESLARFAGQLQHTTGVEDDQVEGLMQLFASFGNTEGAIRTATEAALDFSAATGIDAHAAAMALQKAANGNVGALGRYGISVDKSRAQSEGLAYVAGQVEQRFRGMSSAAMAGVGGGLARLSNTFGDLQEALGGVLTSSGDLDVALAAVNEAVGSVTTFVQENGPSIGTTIAQSAALGIDAFAGLVEASGAVVAAVNDAVTGTATAVNWISGKLSSFRAWQKRNALESQLENTGGRETPFTAQLRQEIAELENAAREGGERASAALQEGLNRGAAIDRTRRELGALAENLRGIAENARINMVGEQLKGFGRNVRQTGADLVATAGDADEQRKAIERMGAAYADLEEDARLALRGIEEDLQRQVWVGWGDDVGTAVREVQAKFDELRERIKEAADLGFDTTRALALASQAQSREVAAVQSRFAKKAERDLAKEAKQTERIGEDLGGHLGRGMRNAIQGDAEGIVQTAVDVFASLLSAFGGPAGGIIGAILGGIFHEGSGSVGRRLMYAHEGMPRMFPDEFDIPIIRARTVEGVLTQRGVAVAGGRQAVEQMNRGYWPGGGDVVVQSLAVQIDGSRIDHRDHRVRQVGDDMRRTIRYGTSEWARTQRAAGLAPGR